MAAEKAKDGGGMMGEAYKRKIENARVGYQVAVGINLHEEQQIWARSNAMLVANGLIVASLGLSVEKHIKLWGAVPLALFMSAAGIMLCVIWLCLIARTSIKATNWVREASKLEQELDSVVQTLQTGNLWCSGWKGKDISKAKYKEIMGRRRAMRVRGGFERWLSNRMRVKDAPYLIVLIFIVIYIVMFSVGVYDFRAEQEIKRYQRQLDERDERIAALEKKQNQQQDTIIELGRQVEQSHRLLEYYQDSWFYRILLRSKKVEE